MRKLGRLTFLVGAAIAVMAVVPASAKTVVVNFSGVLSSATNFTYDDPNLPTASYHPGEAFFGSFSFDTSSPSSPGEPRELSSFNLNIPDDNLTDHFLEAPGDAFFDEMDGLFHFSAGRADTGSGVDIALNFGVPTGQFPSEGMLKNAIGSFSFAENFPPGGTGTGRTQLSLAAPVPEPATWGTMVIGFALTGAAVRRKRRARSLGLAIA